MTKAKLKQSTPLLYTAIPNIIYLRDGEVVVYSRNASRLYQCRYKLSNGKWHRVSTRKASVENTVSVACLLYDEARFRQKLGLAHTAQTFAQIAKVTLINLQQQIDIKGTRVAFDSYVSCIEKYFLPYFGDRRLEELTHKDIVDFELWCNRQMNKKPKASTLNNFSSTWNRLIKTAIDKGYLSENSKVPRLSTQGAKSNPRPAFTRSEIDNLLMFMKTWSVGERNDLEKNATTTA
jgi:hypothetical protein